MLAENGGELQANGQEWAIYPIADTSDRKWLSRTSNHILKETLSCRGWKGFPDAALAIAANGAGDYFLLLKQGNYFGSAVYLWCHETAAMTKVVNDFSELK